MVKKLLCLITALICVIFQSCSKDDIPEEGISLTEGAIYGIVTDSETAEPIRGASVKLSVYIYSYVLLTSSTTYDDGHFEFNNLEPGQYKLEISYPDYRSYTGTLAVQSNHISKIDISLNNTNVRKSAKVTTIGVTENTSASTTIGGSITDTGYPAYTEKGIVISRYISNPTIHDENSMTARYISSGTSANFSVVCQDLIYGAIYHARAYVINSVGIAYGGSLTFKAGSGSDWFEIDNLAIQKMDISSGATWSDANFICQNSRIGDFTNWRLPTLGESNVLYDNQEILNISDEYSYWTSTSYNNGNYYYRKMWDGNYSYAKESGSLRVRAVRTIQ